MKTICTYAVIMVFLVGCVGGKQSELAFQAGEVDTSPIGSSSGGTSGGTVIGSNRAESLAAFKTTVHPLVRSVTCKNCHSSDTNTKQSPHFADPDADKAFDALTQSGRVNLNVPEDSRIVKKLIEQHNCWTSSNCAANSQDMLDAVKEWARLAPPATSANITTGELTFPTALSMAQAEHGTALIQSEIPELWRSEVISGRFVEMQDSTASDGKYLQFAPIDPHPRQADRNLDIDSARFNNCAEFDTARDINTPASRAIKISQESVHVPSGLIKDASNNIVNDGHVPKVASFQFAYIRPDRRLQYAKEVLMQRNYTNIDNYYLKNGYPDFTGVTRSVGSALGDYNGNPVRKSSQNGFNMYANPKFRPWNQVFQSSGNFIQNASLTEVFKDGFAESNDSIKNNLMSSNFSHLKQKILYPVIKNDLKSWYSSTPETFEYNQAIDSSIEAFLGLNVTMTLACPTASCTSTQLIPKMTKIGGTGLLYNNALDCYTVTNNSFQQVDGSLCNGSNTAYFHLIDTYAHVTVDATAIKTRVVNNLSNSSSGAAHDDNETFSAGGTEIFLNQQARTEEHPDYLYFSGASNLSFSDDLENFQATTYATLQSSNCVSCHGSNNPPVGAPQFVNASAAAALTIIKPYINFGDPSKSFRPNVMVHNCTNADPNNCDGIRSALTQSIVNWRTMNEADYQSAGGAQFKKLDNSERLPGRGKYTFKVTEGGKYNVWMKFKNTIGTNATQRVHFRLLRDGTTPVNYSTGSAGAVGGSSCYAWTVSAAQDVWEWKSPGRDSELPNIDVRGYRLGEINSSGVFVPNALTDSRVYFNLAAGATYVLDVIGLTEGMKLDVVGVNLVRTPSSVDSRLEFQPDRRAADGKHVADYKRRILRYDLTSAVGLQNDQKAFFEIEVKKEYGDQNYVFRNPRFIAEKGTGSAFNLKVKGIKVRINGQYSTPDATYNTFEAVTGDNKVLTYAALIALVKGANDLISFSFDSLEVTNEPLSVLYPKGAPPAQVADARCSDIDFFVKNIKPIMKNVRVILTDGINQMVNEFPGAPRSNVRQPQFYNCVSCHGPNHPYYKMSTFTNDEEFCREALSRVNFDDYYQSLAYRGINGTGNHPKFVFVEKFVKNSAGDFRLHEGDPDYVQNFSKGIGDIATKLETGPMLKWTYSEITGHGDYASSNQAASRAKAGQLKRLQVRTIPLTVKNMSWFVAENDMPLIYDPNDPSRLDNALGAMDIIADPGGDIYNNRNDRTVNPVVYDIVGFTTVNGVKSPLTTAVGEQNQRIPLAGSFKNYRAGASNAYDKSTLDWDAERAGVQTKAQMEATWEALRGYYRDTFIEWIAREDCGRQRMTYNPSTGGCQ